MSNNTSIINVEITDTFQSWINKTNELIDLANENVMLAGPDGFTIDGNSTLTGTFTANELVADSGTLGNITVLTLARSVDADSQIVSVSPIKITSSVENIFDLQSTVGNRPILRMINGGNATWSVGLGTSSASSGIEIKTEGATTPQFLLSQSGILTANAFQGSGALLTNISPGAIPNLAANQITSGTFDEARIPNLDASKITTGTIATARLPISATRNEINLADLLNASSADKGFITGRRFRSALTWDNVTNKPTTFTPTSHTHTASDIISGTFADARIPNLAASKITSGVFADARLPASATRSEISLANLENASSSVQGFITGRRFRAALTWDNVANKPTSLPPGPHTHTASDVTSGTFAAARIPNLDASKITSGTFAAARIPPVSINNIPNLPASKITSGTFNIFRIPTLTAVNRTFGSQSNTSDLFVSLTLTMEQSGTVVVWYEASAFGSSSSSSRIERSIFVDGAFFAGGASASGQVPFAGRTIMTSFFRSAGQTFTVQGRNTRLRSVQGSNGTLVVMRIYR